MREANIKLARARLELEAERKGVDISVSLNFMNPDSFLSEDGNVNAEAVTEFVSSLAPSKPAFNQDVLRNAGNHEMYARPDRHSPESFKGLSKAQIAKLVASGALDKLIR